MRLHEGGRPTRRDRRASFAPSACDPTVTRTLEPRVGGDSATARWRVRDLVPPDIRTDMDRVIAALATHDGSRHAELALRIESVALLKVTDQWIIAPPTRDAVMQARIWNFWLEAVNSMEGEPRPSTRTMSVERGIYRVAGVTPIQSVEFCAFECSDDDRVRMQTKTQFQSGVAVVPSGMTSFADTEYLTLPLELAHQLRLGQRVAHLWREELTLWLSFPPYDLYPADDKIRPKVSLDVEAWCSAISAAIEQIVLADMSSSVPIRSSEREGTAGDTERAHMAGMARDQRNARSVHTVSPRSREPIVNPRIVRWFRSINHPYEVAQRAIRRKHTQRPAPPVADSPTRRFITRFARSFVDGWREGVTMYFAPLTAIGRAVRRAWRRRQNRRR